MHTIEKIDELRNKIHIIPDDENVYKLYRSLKYDYPVVSINGMLYYDENLTLSEEHAEQDEDFVCEHITNECNIFTLTKIGYEQEFDTQYVYVCSIDKNNFDPNIENTHLYSGFFLKSRIRSMLNQDEMTSESVILINGPERIQIIMKDRDNIYKYVSAFLAGMYYGRQ